MTQHLSHGAGRREAPGLLFGLTLGLFLFGGAACVPEDLAKLLAPPSVASPPSIAVNLNAVPDAMNDLMVVPPSGFVVNLSISEGDEPLDLGTLQVVAQAWAGGDTPVDLTGVIPTQTGVSFVLPASTTLAEGSHTLTAMVDDTEGNTGIGSISFAVRDFLGSAAPIGASQTIWFDFDSDRDTDPGADFDVDLETFGLAFAGNPTVSEMSREHVIQATLFRVFEAYYFQDPNDLGNFDPIQISFSTIDAGLPNTTQICVGGNDPSGGIAFGNVLYDFSNSFKDSSECLDFIPTGVFPREFLWFQNQPAFQQLFDALRPATGGTPVGADPLDAAVLAETFDYETATPAEQARFDLVMSAIDAFAGALGTILAHETAHALGLVSQGPPGAGFFGDLTFHNEAVGGGVPATLYLMNPGSAFTNWSALAGISGHPSARFREYNFAYLRDRVVSNASVSEILGPPFTFGVSPETINQASTMITVSGVNFDSPITIRLVNPTYTYNTIGEQVTSLTTATAFVLQAQILPGTYSVEVSNSDGQKAVLPDAIVVY